MFMPLSIVIRTFNSSRTLPQVFENLHLKEGDEVLVVDSGSSDTTLQQAGDFGARVIRLTGPFNYSRSLNAGFAAAANEWVLTLSSHCIPVCTTFLDDWRVALASLEDDVPVAFGPRQLSPEDRRASETITFQTAGNLGDGIAVHGGSSNGAYRRSVWEAHGFQETLKTGEDREWAEWSLRHGYRVAFVPQVPVLYRNQGSLRYMFEKGLIEAQTGRRERHTFWTALRSFSINLASLTRKLWCGSIRIGTFLRQVAHSAGASLGGYLPNNPRHIP